MEVFEKRWQISEAQKPPSGQGRDRPGRSGAGVWELPSGQVDKIIRSAGYQEGGLRGILYRTKSW